MQLGNSASGNGISNGTAKSQSPTLAYNNGSLFAAWQDNSSGVLEIYAALWNGVAWSPAGSGAASGGGVSAGVGPATDPQLAANGGGVYLLWLDNRVANLTGNSEALYVEMWNGSAFVQQVIGDASYRGIGDAVDAPSAPALAISPNGQPFAAWQDTSDGAAQIYVRGDTFDVTGNFYLNGSSTAGDAFSTAAGNASASGITPATPNTSVANLTGLQPGDLIYVDAGTYSNLNLTSTDNGVLLLGSDNGPTIIEGSVTITGASQIILEDLVIEGGVNLINCTAVTLTGCTIYGNGITVTGGTGNQIVHDVITGSNTGITLTNAALDMVIEYNQILGGSQGIAITGSGVAGLVVSFNQLAGSETGIALNSPAAGQISDNRITSLYTALQIEAAFSGSIDNNDFSAEDIGVLYQAAAPLNNNLIYDSSIGISTDIADPANALGFVAGSQPNQIFDNTMGVQLQGATIELQHIYANQTGVGGTGNLIAADLAHANFIEENTTGVDVVGTIEFNRIEGNIVGIEAQSNQLIAHNLLVRNSQTAIEIQGQTNVSVVNNTLYTPSGDLVRIEDQSSVVELENNIFWTSNGYDIYVANDSQVGFFSDYNDLYADGSGILVHWDINFTDILDWQDDVDEFDLQSVGSTVVNPTWARPRFVGLAMDDYRIDPLLAGLGLTSPTVNAGNPLTDEGLPTTYQNLLTDPGFESGLTGWTATPSGGTQSSNPAPWEGNNYFFAGANAVTTLTQTVNLTSSGFTAAQIDSDNLSLLFGGRVRSAAETPPDSGSISVTFYDGNGNMLGTDSVNADNDTDRWELVGERVSIPAGARTALFTFTAFRNSGTTDNSYLDAAFVSVQSDDSVPDQGA